MEGQTAKEQIATIRRLSQAAAAALLSMTARALRAHPDAPRADDGSYDGPALVRWFAGRGDTRWREARTLKLSRDAERAEIERKLAALKLAKLQGSVVPLEKHERDIDVICGAFRNVLTSAPNHLAARLVGKDAGEVREILTEWCNQNRDHFFGPPEDGDVDTQLAAGE